MAQQGSILAADFGSVSTRVVMVDLVDGAYRLVARAAGRTTAGYPKDDVSIGLGRIVDGMTQDNERVIFGDSGQVITPENANREGVDYFITTASAGRPMRVAIVGLMPDVSITTALRAMSGTYIKVVATLSLLDAMNEEERLNAITISRPDLIFITGGTDGGATTSLEQLLKLVQLALKLTEGVLRPVVLYAGNTDLVGQVRETFEPLTQVFIADNIRPTMQEEQLASALTQIGRAYNNYNKRTARSFGNIRSSTGLLPTAQSYSVMTAFLAKLQRTNVMSVDIGGASTVLAGVFNGQGDIRIDTDIGLGHSASALLEAVGYDAIRGWLPFSIEDRDLINYALNKTLRPASVPMNLRDLYIEHALLRAGLRHVMTQARGEWRGLPSYGPLPDVGVILAGGAALTGTGNGFFDMLLLADVIQPTGITQIIADPYGLVPALGAMAQIRPEAVVQLLEANTLPTLGTLISIAGDVRPDKPALRLNVTASNGETADISLPGGHLLSLALPANETLVLSIECLQGLTINGQRKLKLSLSGGIAGILIDARGRPLRIASNVRQRSVQMPQWLHEATDEPLQAIPAEWIIEADTAVDASSTTNVDEYAALLDAPETDSAQAEDAEANGKRRRGLFGRRRRKQATDTDLGVTQLDELPDIAELDADGEADELGFDLDLDDADAASSRDNDADDFDLDALLGAEDNERTSAAEKENRRRRSRGLLRGGGKRKQDTQAQAKQSEQADDDLGSLLDLLDN